MIKTLFVGSGLSIRAFHAPFLFSSSVYAPLAVVRRQPEAVEGIALPVYTLLEDALRELKPDLVVIGTPNEFHKQQAIQALRAGAHVVVDKPIATSSRELDVMLAVAGEEGKILCAYQNRRWDGDFLTLQNLMRDKRLGKIVRFESRFDKFRPEPKGGWKEEVRPGSGMWFDLGPHLLDQALVLFGRPDAITASIRTEREGMQTDDAFDVWLHYADTLVVLGASSLVAAPLARFRVLGDRGSYLKFGLDPQEACLRAGELPDTAGWGEEDKAAWGTLTEIVEGEVRSQPLQTEAGNYADFYTRLAEAILQGKPAPVSADDSRLQLRLLEAGLESKGRRIEI